MTDDTVLREIEEGMLQADPARVQDLLDRLEPETLAPERIVEAMTRGMERARMLLKGGACSIPEFLLCIDAFRQGVRSLQRGPDAIPRRSEGVVIGVVEGDVHDLGKNIVAGVLEASGYRVHDLGKDVTRDAFLEAIERTRPALLALSSMMSTPLQNMRDIIHWARKLHPTVGILVGGAPLDERLARSMGADGYAEGAGDVPEEARRVLELRGRSLEVAAVCKT